jgi:hypothetical protein
MEYSPSKPGDYTQIDLPQEGKDRGLAVDANQWRRRGLT